MIPRSFENGLIPELVCIIENESEDPFKFCLKHFNHHYYLLNFVRRFTLEKNHIIAIIVTKSFHNLKLQRYERNHTGEKPYAYKYRDQRFFQSQSAKYVKGTSLEKMKRMIHYSFYFRFLLRSESWKSAASKS